MRLSIEELRTYLVEALDALVDSNIDSGKPITSVNLTNMSSYVERPYVDKRVSENTVSMKVRYVYVRPTLTADDRQAFAAELANKIVQFNVATALPGQPGTAWVVATTISEYSEVDDKGKPVMGFVVVYEMVSYTRQLVPTENQAMNSRLFVPLLQKPRLFTLVGHANAPIASADSLSQVLEQYAQKNGDWRLHTVRSILYHHVRAGRLVHLKMAEVREVVEELTDSAILKEGAL